MIFTQAFRPFGMTSKKGLFHNNPSFEMVQYPQRRSSTEDLTKASAGKPPSGRTRTKKVIRRTNTDPGPLPLDILTILLEQLPQCPRLNPSSKRQDDSPSSSSSSTQVSSGASSSIPAHKTSVSSPASMSALSTSPAQLNQAPPHESSHHWQTQPHLHMSSPSLPTHSQTNSSIASSNWQASSLSWDQIRQANPLRVTTPPSQSGTVSSSSSSYSSGHYPNVSLPWQPNSYHSSAMPASSYSSSSSHVMTPASSWQPPPSSSLSTSPAFSSSPAPLTSSSVATSGKMKEWKPARYQPPQPSSKTSTATSKPTTTATDNRYNYVPTNQPTPAERARQERLQEEKRKRDGPQPDASYSRSLPEYNPVKSPNINDDELDDFDFSPPVRVPQAKQEVLPKVERSVSLEKKITKASAVALYPFNAQNTKELSFKKGDTIYLTRDVDKNWFEGEHHGNKGIFPKSYVEVVTSIEEARSLMLDTPSMEGKAKAKYKFKGETANELSVNKSEIIDLIRKVDANWWEARVGTRHGIVPVAYVDVLREPQAGVTSPQLSPGGFGKSATSPSPKSPKSPSYQPQSKNPIGYSSTLPSPSSANRSPADQTLPSYGGLSGRGDDPRRPAQNAGYHQRPSEPSKQFSTGIQERFRAVYSYQPNNDDELELMEGDMVTVMEKCDDGWFVGFSESTGLFGTFPGNYVEKI